MKVVKAEMLHFAQSYGKDANNRKMQLLLRRQKPLLRATKRIIRVAVYKIFYYLSNENWDRERSFYFTIYNYYKRCFVTLSDHYVNEALHFFKGLNVL